MRFFTATGAIGLFAAFGMIVTAMAVSPKHHKETNPLRAIVARADRASEVFSPTWAESFLAAQEPAGSTIVSGSCQVTYPATSCQGDGNPLVVPRTRRPTWGHPVVVDWYTYPTVPPALPNYPCWLLVSTKPSTPVSLNAWHADGCWLLVVPQWVLTPTNGTILTQSEGHIQLNWIPDVAFKGAVWYMQLLVAEPGKNVAGYKLSSLLKLTIGG